MARWSYLGVLAFIVVGAGWLELALHTRVLRRWRRLLCAVLPVAALLYVWDVYAVHQRHWWFDPTRMTGIVLPGGVPLEELLFFLIVPTAAVLTLEAVRAVRGWPAGDEVGGAGVDA